jgi:hypothetical protein
MNNLVFNDQSETPTIKIAIASNVHFCDLTLPIIIPSLLQNGIPKDEIFVFIAGCSEYSEKIVDGIVQYELTHNSYEYSPLIEICEREHESEYWFLIHDTCKVGKNFKRLLYNIPPDRPSKIALGNSPVMSIGAYRFDYLLSVKERLYEIKNTDYSIESMRRWKDWGAPNEDYILWKTAPPPAVYGNHGMEILDHENWYGTNTIRRTEYFHSLDIYKNKSNWGQSFGNMILTI